MAEALASLKKIGGNGEQYTETVLWTNPSPTAQFAGQTVTLSDSIANYKYLKVKACYNGGYTNVAVSPLILVSEFMTVVASTRRCTFNIGNSSASNAYYSRAVQYVSPTSISFTDDWALKSNNTANTDVIPLEILGINELDHNGTVRSAFCISGTSAGTTYGHGGSSSDTTLMDVDSGGTNTQAKSYTVKRDAKGKVGFSFCNRGTVTRYPTVKLNVTDIYSGRLDYWIISALPLIDVTLSANDVIELSCGQSTSQLISMYFIEE